MTAERAPRPGEACQCGRPALVVFLTGEHGDVPWCGIPDGGAGPDERPGTGQADTPIQEATGTVSAAAETAEAVVRSADAVERHLGWLRTRGLSEETVKLRRVAVAQLAAAVAPRPLLEVTAADLQRFQLDLGGRVTRASEATYIAQLRQWLKWAAKHEGTSADLADELIMPKLPRALPRPIAEDDLAAAVAAASARIRPWLALAAYGGLRASEIAGLRAEDVHLAEEPPWLLVRGKGAKERAVPAGETVVRALREAGVPRHGPVFPRGDGLPGPIAPWRVSQLAARHLHQLGIAASLHQLRHRFATAVYRQSADLLLTADLLGHANVNTTRRYAAADATKGAAAVRALDPPMTHDEPAEQDGSDPKERTS